MLTKELTASEKEQLGNEKPMVNYQLRQWEKAPKVHIEENIVSHSIFDKIITKCWNEQRPTQRNKKYYRIGYSIAATVAILITCLWIANNVSPSYITISAPLNDKLAILLPDSSKVWLSSASQIRYRESFEGNREVLLDKGEAFFKVEKVYGSSFRVSFQGSQIEVTGTEFNVKSGNIESEITLFTGSIKFKAEKGKEELLLKPSQRIVYNANEKSTTLTTIDTSEYDWRSEKHRFINKPLQDFIDFINRNYQVNVMINKEQLKKLKFNGTIRKDEPLNNILDKICISLDLKKKQENDSIILY